MHRWRLACAMLAFRLLRRPRNPRSHPRRSAATRLRTQQSELQRLHRPLPDLHPDCRPEHQMLNARDRLREAGMDMYRTTPRNAAHLKTMWSAPRSPPRRDRPGDDQLVNGHHDPGLRASEPSHHGHPPPRRNHSSATTSTTGEPPMAGHLPLEAMSGGSR